MTNAEIGRITVARENGGLKAATGVEPAVAIELGTPSPGLAEREQFAVDASTSVMLQCPHGVTVVSADGGGAGLWVGE